MRNRLKVLRAEHNWSQAELAARLLHKLLSELDEYAVEDAAFLAGVVAARLSRDSIGVISGYDGCRCKGQRLHIVGSTHSGQSEKEKHEQIP